MRSADRRRRAARGTLVEIAAVAALGLALAGCSTLRGPTLPAPPAQALQPCPAPVLQGGTNGDLAIFADDLRSALRTCDLQVKTLREWAADNID